MSSGSFGDAESVSGSRAEVQARLLQQTLAGKGAQVAIARAADGGIDYLYQAGGILVKDAYLDRVRAAMRPARTAGGPHAAGDSSLIAAGDSGLIEGVTLLSLGPYSLDVPGTLD